MSEDFHSIQRTEAILVTTHSMDEAHCILRSRFALDQFRPGQAEVIERLIGGKNVAAVFPTGGGKSLCYQLPSQIFSGTTVVVSPLIALMKDQCDALAEKGIRAARLDSSLTGDQFRQAMREIRDGSVRLLYIAPERFFNERFLASVGSLDISLFAIDEAHCISQWGHNFRPDYLKLADLAKRLSADRVLALTATATPAVLDDIRTAFSIDSDDAIRTPFHRSNLKLRSSIVEESSQFDALLDRISSRPRGATLIYVSQQKTAEQVAQRLTDVGYVATAYHAGMDAEQRSDIQRRFLDSDDAIIVATIAFGMGIDKPNIRYVYHFNPPKSLEAYAQETGRAGRDGKDSICEMLLQPTDRIVLENFTHGDTPSRHSVGRLIDLCHGQPDEFFLSHYKVAYETDIRILVVRTLLTYLELDGYLSATAPRYETYKIHPLVTSAAILANFDGERRQFLAEVLGQLTKSKKWFSLNMVSAARALQQDRERIVKAVDFMAAQNWIEVQVSDLVHGYRWRRRIEHPKVLADEFYDRVIQREQSEIGRLDEVFELASASECQSNRLARHFGDDRVDDCGACSYCNNDGPFSIASIPEQSIGDAARKALAEVARDFPDHLTTNRAKARFLCGLPSPQMSRSRLTRHSSFGVCQRIPFASVLRQVSES